MPQDLYIRTPVTVHHPSAHAIMHYIQNGDYYYYSFFFYFTFPFLPFFFLVRVVCIVQHCRQFSKIQCSFFLSCIYDLVYTCVNQVGPCTLRCAINRMHLSKGVKSPHEFGNYRNPLIFHGFSKLDQACALLQTQVTGFDVC